MNEIAPRNEACSKRRLHKHGSGRSLEVWSIISQPLTEATHLKFPFVLPDAKDFDAVGFGLNAVDHLVVMPHYPSFDTKTRLIEHTLSAGGQAATAMVTLQRLGAQTAYGGRFGSDAAGQFGLSSIKDEGIDIEFVEVIEGARNQIAFIIVDARSGERTIMWDRDDRLGYSVSDAPTSVAARGRVLHVDAHDPPASARMAEVARAGGTIVSADIDNVYDGLPDLLPLIDVLITSKAFPYRVTGITEERTALIELKNRYGCAVVGITRGEGGAIVYGDGQFLESPAYKVPGGCRDTTGAGDAFHGGFLYGMLSGEDVETSLKLANATAALKCRALGGRKALPRLSELREFLASATPIHKRAVF